MSGSVNKVILVGNVGADPEIRRNQQGNPIANIRLATSEQWRDKNTGERKERSDWHTIVCFSEGLCKVIEQYVSKGSKLYIEGALKTRSWEDQSGNKRFSTEVVLQGFDAKLIMLDPATANNTPKEPKDTYGNQSRSLHDDLDDEIPPF